MFEITKSMMENAIESARQNNAASDKAVKKIVTAILIVLVLQLAVFFGILSGSLLRGLLFGAITVVVDLVLFALIVIIATKKYDEGIELRDFFHAFFDQKFDQSLRKADLKTQIKMYEEKLPQTKSRYSKARYTAALTQLYLADGRIEDAGKLLEEMKKLSVKSSTAQVFMFSSELSYYNATNEHEKYIAAFENSKELLRVWWGKDLVMKFMLFSNYIGYLMGKEENQKALELLDCFFAVSDKAAEFDARFAPSDEAKYAASLDYARLYCKLGDKEKALEHFRKAEEKFADTDKPLLKKELERARELLEKEGVLQSRS